MAENPACLDIYLGERGNCFPMAGGQTYSFIMALLYGNADNKEVPCRGSSKRLRIILDSRNKVVSGFLFHINIFTIMNYSANNTDYLLMCLLDNRSGYCSIFF